MQSNLNSSPVAKPKTKTKQVKSKIETLCDDVVKLAISMRSNTANDNTFNDIMQSVLTEKVVSAKLDRSTVNRMVDFLATTADMHSLNFQIAKNRLLKEYVDHPFSDAQRRVIDDLAVLEVNNDSVEEQLMFSLYFEKYVKLMLRYHLASNTRSKQAVEAVMAVLKNQEFDSMGIVKSTQLNASELIMKRISQAPICVETFNSISYGHSYSTSNRRNE